MLERNVELAYPNDEERQLYTSLMEEGRKLFSKKTDRVTIFHQVLIDRVADAYISCLRTDVDGASFNEKRYKAAQEKLQRWLSLTFQELNSAERITKAKQEFYEACVSKLTSVVSDIGLRKEVFACLKKLVDEGG